MATTPAEITIFDEIEARAANITTGNGYWTTQKNIERSKLTPFAGGDYPAFSFWPVAAPQDDDRYGGEDHTLSIILGYFTDVSEDEPYADIASKLKSDVVTAMHRATGAPQVSDEKDYNLGGLVQGFRVSQADFVINQGHDPYVGILVEVEIDYKSDMGNPYQVLTGAEPSIV